MSSFPLGYKPMGFIYSNRQPFRSDVEKQRLYWMAYNDALAEKNAVTGRALREKNGDVPRLDDVYNREADKQKQAARQAEIDASPYSFVNRMPSSMLPKSDAIVQEFKRKFFGSRSID